MTVAWGKFLRVELLGQVHTLLVFIPCAELALKKETGLLAVKKISAALSPVLPI